ncbi:MAG: sigma-54-dependent Fis family transcriptional regulator [Chitinophagales bacterium]|nr:sigma-54-dependent Fis family transcriptional regulator [Chitinophagales bacterium]
MPSILIIDDDVDMCLLLQRFLTKNNYQADIAHSGAKALVKMSEKKYQLVLCDFRLGDTDGREMLKTIKSLYPAIVVIIVTGYSDIRIAVDVVKLGAFDYITKPLIPAEVLIIIEKALSYSGIIVSSTQSTDQEATKQVSRTESFFEGSGPESREVYMQIQVIAPTSYSVIVYGESGTGKEVVAKAIHSKSERKEYPFIALDCGTLTKELAGSELFGHEKGAFTGAVATKTGHFELAHKGTLLLDEVANLPYDVQVSLLRVIQERKFKRVGGIKDIEVDVRIIVASNENLQDAYKKGKFREDLYHRFNEFSIHVPPLRLRKDDIMNFANYFLDISNSELDKKITGFDQEVTELFMHYAWPGNLRELRNIIRRAALLTDKGEVKTAALPVELANFHLITEPTDSKSAELSSQPDNDLKSTAAEAELQAIRRVLKQVNYNKTRAAKLLNIDRKTLYNKMRHLEV